MLLTKKNIFFLGIGGIGMSALAQFFLYHNHNIAGYDAVLSENTEKLEKLGITVIYKEDLSSIPDKFKDSNSTLVVYTPAINENSELLSYFRKNNFETIKRADLLALVSKLSKTIAIAGTHGKTTTTALTSHIFNLANKLNFAFVGGIMNNYESNLIINNYKPDNYIVLEADEYDRAFLKLNPNSAIITSIDPDHLDIYTNENNYRNAFKEFSAKIQDKLIISDLLSENFFQSKKIFKYGLSEEANFSASNIRIENAQQKFEINYPQGKCEATIILPGKINIYNSLAAFAMAYLTGIDIKIILQGLKTFKGTKRRFEKIYEGKRILITDYAHHPEEIKGFYYALRDFYPQKHITAIFQPHLYSRTKDFAEQFSQALDLFDQIILLPIYAARENPMEGVDSSILTKKLTKKHYLCDPKNLLDTLKKLKIEIITTIGAGDIYKLNDQITEFLKKVEENET